MDGLGLGVVGVVNDGGEVTYDEEDLGNSQGEDDISGLLSCRGEFDVENDDEDGG